jgi:hypothetical protein
MMHNFFFVCVQTFKHSVRRFEIGILKYKSGHPASDFTSLPAPKESIHSVEYNKINLSKIFESTTAKKKGKWIRLSKPSTLNYDL